MLVSSADTAFSSSPQHTIQTRRDRVRIYSMTSTRNDEPQLTSRNTQGKEPTAPANYSQQWPNYRYRVYNVWIWNSRLTMLYFWEISLACRLFPEPGGPNSKILGVWGATERCLDKTYINTAKWNTTDIHTHYATADISGQYVLSLCVCVCVCVHRLSLLAPSVAFWAKVAWKKAKEDSTFERKITETEKQQNKPFGICSNACHNPSGRLSFGQMSPNWSYLASHISSVFADKIKRSIQRKEHL